MHERAFVLQPLVEIAPELPIIRGAARKRGQKCKDQGVERID